MAAARNQAIHTCAYVWDSKSLFAPASMRSPPHALSCALVLMTLDGPLNLRCRRPGNICDSDAVVVAPNLRHSTDAAGRTLAILVDLDDDAYRYIHPLLDGEPIRALPADRVEAARAASADFFTGQLDCHAALERVTRVLALLCPSPLVQLPWDPRILRACALMRGDTPNRLSGRAQLAATVGLSESRLTHLFRQQLGLTLRHYQLWMRLRWAMRLWRDERTVSDIALGAGFYDQAHFTRTLRRMTGYVPSFLRPPEVQVNLSTQPQPA